MITRAERAALAQAGVAALLEEIPAPREPEAEGPKLPTPADLAPPPAAPAGALAARTAPRPAVARRPAPAAATYAACPDYPAAYDPEAELEAGI